MHAASGLFAIRAFFCVGARRPCATLHILVEALNFFIWLMPFRGADTMLLSFANGIVFPGSSRLDVYCCCGCSGMWSSSITENLLFEFSLYCSVSLSSLCGDTASIWVASLLSLTGWSASAFIACRIRLRRNMCWSCQVTEVVNV